MNQNFAHFSFSFLPLKNELSLKGLLKHCFNVCFVGLLTYKTWRNRGPEKFNMGCTSSYFIFCTKGWNPEKLFLTTLAFINKSIYWKIHMSASCLQSLTTVKTCKMPRHIQINYGSSINRLKVFSNKWHFDLVQLFLGISKEHTNQSITWKLNLRGELHLKSMTVDLDERELYLWRFLLQRFIWTWETSRSKISTYMNSIM